MREKWVWSLYREDLLEKEMATHSKILAWNKRTEEPAAAAESLQSCPTLRYPIDGSPSGSPIPGILQAGTLEWVAISFSNAWKWSRSVVSDPQWPQLWDHRRLRHDLTTQQQCELQLEILRHLLCNIFKLWRTRCLPFLLLFTDFIRVTSKLASSQTLSHKHTHKEHFEKYLNLICI